MNLQKISIPFSDNIQTGYSSHTKLSELANQLNALEGAFEISLDFSKISFIASNQFAILGCILDTYMDSHPTSKIFMINLNKKIMETIQKNGFNVHLDLKKLPDIHNTVIPYTIFDISKIDEFERYIMLSIFKRTDIPKMSEKVRGRIIDNILEIFNNVKEHTHSQKVYACGQYFPKSSLLYFTIVDSGETIPYNVNEYFKRISTLSPAKTLEWALGTGNTTRISETPGGLGLSLLKDFVELNAGHFYIVSGNETFEKKGKKERHMFMTPSFPGTIVTVAFNLSDENIYHMSSDIFSEIFF